MFVPGVLSKSVFPHLNLTQTQSQAVQGSGAGCTCWVVAAVRLGLPALKTGSWVVGRDLTLCFILTYFQQLQLPTLGRVRDKVGPVGKGKRILMGNNQCELPLLSSFPLGYN